MHSKLAAVWLCTSLGFCVQASGQPVLEWRQLDMPSGEPHPTARFGHAMAFDSARGVIVVFGGTDQGGTQFTDTWEFDGESWTERKVPGPGPSMYGHKMAFDSTRGVCVLWDGVFDTWEWDGERWRRISTNLRPEMGRGSAMAFDEARSEIVVYGGCDEFQCGLTGPGYVITWLYDGADWEEVRTGLYPWSRFDHVMSYDAEREVVVLFGGQEGGEFAWEWDGDEWIVIGEVGPIGRERAAMAYHKGLDRTLVVGGDDLRTFRSDIWSWDGAAWERIGAPNQPDGRRGHGMVFDGRRMVLFGGEGTEGDALGDLWVLDAECPGDCDYSGTRDVFDFLCFQDAFIRGEPGACDCDTSTGLSVCDVFDFLCFQDEFTSACP